MDNNQFDCQHNYLLGYFNGSEQAWDPEIADKFIDKEPNF